MTGSTASWRVGAACLALSAALALAGRAAGTRIAFAVDAAPDGRTSRIFIAEATGAGMRPVTPGAAREKAPALSPDGKRLAYQSTNDLGIDTILVQAVDGDEKPRALALGMNPQWSRDGKRLLFARRINNDYSLFVIRADGSEKDAGLKPLAPGRLGRWSPDEKQLAVVAPVIHEGKNRWQIQVMPADTLQPGVRLTLPESFGQVVSLDWSPNAQSLLFSVVRQAQHDLYVVDLKAPDPRKVPAGGAVPNAGYGSWSPDGKQILFRCAVGEEGSGVLSRLCVMNADGTGVRTRWEPEDRSLRVHGTAWQHPVTVVAQGMLPVERKPAPPAPPSAQPEPRPEPKVEAPRPKVEGPAVLLHGEKLFRIEQPRSPVSLAMTAPGPEDFLVSVPVLPSPRWRARRQGVGITLELEDGSLYRGTVIYSGVPWATLQGRPREGKVRLIAGEKLDPAGTGFRKGFKLSLRRDGANMMILVNDREVLSRPVLTAPVRSLSLTLENFDPGVAPFNLGAIHYKEWVEAPAPVEAAKDDPEKPEGEKKDP